MRLKGLARWIWTMILGSQIIVTLITPAGAAAAEGSATNSLAAAPSVTASNSAAESAASVQMRMAELQQLIREAAAHKTTDNSVHNDIDNANNATNTVNVNNINNLKRLNQLAGQNDNGAASLAGAATDAAADPDLAGAIKQLIPMSPEQIHKLREVYAETQAAASVQIGSDAKPTSSALVVNLAPNATPPVIRLGAGYITSVVFLDSSGQPWPIAAYSLGDPNSFNIQWDRKGNTLLIQSSTFYRNSNLAVILKGLNTPVMITLMSGQAAIDYRVDLRVPGFGPNAVFIHNTVTESSDPLLLSILNGIPPNNAKELKISGVASTECRAWMIGHKLYLRTALHLISPGWQAVMGSVDGMKAYRMQYAPVLLVTRNGNDNVININLNDNNN